MVPPKQPYQVTSKVPSGFCTYNMQESWKPGLTGHLLSYPSVISPVRLGLLPQDRLLQFKKSMLSKDMELMKASEEHLIEARASAGQNSWAHWGPLTLSHEEKVVWNSLAFDSCFLGPNTLWLLLCFLSVYKNVIDIRRIHGLAYI